MTYWPNKARAFPVATDCDMRNVGKVEECKVGVYGSHSDESSSNLDEDELLEDFGEKTSLLYAKLYEPESRKRQMQIQLQEHQLKDLYMSQEHAEQRHHIYRGARRRLYFVLFILLLFFLLLYFALYLNVQMRYAPHHDWGYNTSRNISDYVLPEKKTTLLQPRDVCQEKAFLLILVCSSIQNFTARQIIRETWGNSSTFNYDMFHKLHNHLKGQYLEPSLERFKHYAQYLRLKKLSNMSVSGNMTAIVANDVNHNYLAHVEVPVRILFLMGRNKMDSHSVADTIAIDGDGEGDSNTENLYSNDELRLHHELLQHNDIIQEDFVDTYSNLTIKSVMALKWITQSCLDQFAFIMKCDDDTFVNVPNILHYLLGGTMPIYNDTLDLYGIDPLAPSNRLKSIRNYLTGYLFCNTRPVSNISRKWYMPFFMFPQDKYPPYLSGSGYIMSSDVVRNLYAIAQNTPLIYLEDVYLTGICAQELHLARQHQPLFGYTRTQKLCQFRGTFTQHEMKDDSLYDAYAFVTNISHFCPPPTIERFFHRLRLHKSAGHCH